MIHSLLPHEYHRALSASINTPWLSSICEAVSCTDTSADCYKYSIIDEYGTVYEPDDIFYTSEGAEREGREAINTVSS